MPEPVTVIHEAVDAEVHAHPDCAVTVIVPVAPEGGALMATTLGVNVHDAPGWLTRKLRPAIVSVAVLAVVLVLGCAVNETLPEPVPDEPLDIVTHDAPLVAVQVHP